MTIATMIVLALVLPTGSALLGTPLGVVPAAADAGPLRNVTIAPSTFQPGAMVEVTLNITLEPSADGLPGPGVTGEPAYDRVSIRYGNLSISVLDVPPYNLHGLANFIDNECVAHSEAAASFPLFISPTANRYHVCDDGEFIHITIGSLNFSPDDNLTIILQLSGVNTTAGEYTLEVELFNSGRGMDFILGVPAQSTLRENGAVGATLCDQVPDAVPGRIKDVVNQTACPLSLYGAFQVPYTVVPGAPVDIRVEGPATLQAGEEGNYTFTLSDAYGNVVDTQVIPFSSTLAGEHTDAVCSSFGAAGVAEVCVTVTVTPGDPAMIIADGPTELLLGSSASYTFSLQDEFGNEITNQTRNFDAESIGVFNVCSTFGAPGVPEECVSVDVRGPMLVTLSVSCPATADIASLVTCTANGTDEFGGSADLSDLQWSAENAFGQSVSITDGTFTAPNLTSAGPVTVTASLEGLSDSAAVSLQAAEVSFILIRTAAINGGQVASGARTVPADETRSFCAAGYDSWNNYAGDQVVDWTVTTTSGAGIGAVAPDPAACTTFTPDKLGTGSISVVSADGLTHTTGTITVIAGALHEVVFVSPPATTSADSNVVFSLETRDVKGNLRGDTVTCAVVNGTGAIEGTCTFVPDKVGNVTIQATAGDKTADHTVNVTVGALHHVAFIDSATTTDADTNVTFNVVARDRNNNPRDDAVTCSVLDGPGLIEAPCKYVPDLTGYAVIKATAGAGSPATHTLLVTPGALAGFSLSTPMDADAGVQFLLGIEALDGNGNRKTDYTGTVSLSTTDSAATITAEVTFSAGDAGLVSTGVTLKTSPLPLRVQNITVVDLATGINATSDDIFVTPGSPAVPNGYAFVAPFDAHQFVAASDTVTAWLIVTDDFGNRVLDGETVYFFLAAGATNSGTGSLSGSFGTTDADGLVSVDLTVSSDAGDIFRVRAGNNADYDSSTIQAVSGLAEVS